MRTSAQSSLATVLLLVPILAVPMLAIFGVPQFTPVVASPYEDNASSRRLDESEAPPFSPRSGERDAFEKVASNISSDVTEWGDDTNDDRAARTLADRRGVTTAGHRRNAPVAESTEPSPFAQVGESQAVPLMNEAMPGSYRRPRSNSEVVDPRPKRAPLRTTPAVLDPQLTWRDAVQKLNSLEIRNFRLEPGQQPLQFIFSCSYTPRDTPAVSYRFEAEADEPLRAVERVLEQIDTWLAAH